MTDATRTTSRASASANPNDPTEPVHLGFSVPLEDDDSAELVGHRSPNWEEWDGGQLGGRPTWLEPCHLPKAPLTCQACQSLLRFVCQFYAPLDDPHHHAFHRSLYVFACTHCHHPTQSIRVLRVQLPKDNPYYPNELPLQSSWDQHLPETHNRHLCIVCGQRAKGKCPQQDAYFCSTEHQKAHKKKLKHTLYPESELVVEEAESEEACETDQPATLFSNNNDDKDDEQLEQEDLNQWTGAAQHKTDPVTLEFYAHIPKNVQTQCLRYQRRGRPLWIQTKQQCRNVPNCPHCQSPRQFECQLMPQMIHYLEEASSTNTDAVVSSQEKQALLAASTLVDSNQASDDLKQAHAKAIHGIQRQLLHSHKNDELNWGVVAIYTCTNSCTEEHPEEQELGAYREEYAWRQPSLDDDEQQQQEDDS